MAYGRAALRNESDSTAAALRDESKLVLMRPLSAAQTVSLCGPRAESRFPDLLRHQVQSFQEGIKI